jgi:hypothetical protein
VQVRIHDDAACAAGETKAAQHGNLLTEIAPKLNDGYFGMVFGELASFCAESSWLPSFTKSSSKETPAGPSAALS